MMNQFIQIQKKLLPDLLEVMHKRYRILQHIRLLQPIGRRALATHLSITERVLRSEVMLLKDQSLIDVLPSGMSLTSTGASLLIDLEEMIKETLGLFDLETKLKSLLKIDEVVIVPGNCDESDLVKFEIGRACVAKFKECLEIENKVAVTGGTTVAAVAEMMTPLPKEKRALFLPARGGLGENVENQANSICAKLAERSRGEYKLLHVPAQVNEEAYDHIVSEPSVKEVLDTLQSPSIVIHGIGDAETMALKRKSSPEELEKIRRGEAVAEAFGYYFDKTGNVIHKVSTIGLQLENVKLSPCVLAVAGGASKAGAISAYIKQANNTILITDEGAAKALLN